MVSLTEQFLPKMELKLFLAVIIPGLIVSVALLLLFNSYLDLKLLPSDITSIDASYLTLLLLYLFVSSLFFGIILMFAVLLILGNLTSKFKKYPIEGSKIERFIKNVIRNRFRDEIRTQILESYRINVDYKNEYRIFFGSTCVALLLVFILFLIAYFNTLLALSLFYFFILLFSFFAYYVIRKDIIKTPVELIFSFIKIDNKKIGNLIKLDKKKQNKNESVIEEEICEFFRNRLKSDNGFKQK